jgi:hypothetical protein
MSTYLEIIEKLQNQTLDNVKKLQAVQIATLTTARELIAELPNTKGLPTLSQITELGSTFANQLLDQQKTFVTQLADAVKPPAELASLTKSSTN